MPALRVADSRILTENAAILAYLADRFAPAANPSDFARYELAQWLGFIGAELYKQVYTPLL